MTNLIQWANNGYQNWNTTVWSANWSGARFRARDVTDTDYREKEGFMAATWTLCNAEHLEVH